MIWLPVVGNYTDIDVYASIVAYTDLLNQRGKQARAYIPSSAPNYSVPELLRVRDYEGGVFELRPDDEAIILDVSLPDVIGKLVPEDHILELIDHHPGYEEHWKGQLGNRAIIEKIGAVATLVFEWWGKCWDYGKMSPDVAKLLLAAILDNTLYFNAEITTQRDRDAADKLAGIARITVEEFADWYFSEVSKTICGGLKGSLLLDHKMVSLPGDEKRLAFAQITIWDAQDVLARRNPIEEIMHDINQNWVVNVICLQERRNYILGSSEGWKRFFMNLLSAHEYGDWLKTDRLFLRKEIIGKVLGRAYR